MSELLSQVAHRPYPLPAGPFVMHQVWHELAFLHWPVPAAELGRVMPPGLPLDTFGGSAYLAVVPFRMSGVRPRWLPAVPGVSAFPELNVRTYVTLDGKPGVYFFSLDAGNKLAVRLARRLFHLPYFDARMTLLPQRDADGNEEFLYRSERTHLGAPAAALHARYRPVAPVQPAERGSLEEWLTERYCMYPVDPQGRIYRGEIHHLPWPLQRATAELTACTMSAPLGVPLPGPPPLVHFARRLDVVVWPLQRIRE